MASSAPPPVTSRPPQALLLDDQNPEGLQETEMEALIVASYVPRKTHQGRHQAGFGAYDETSHKRARATLAALAVAAVTLSMLG